MHISRTAFIMIIGTILALAGFFGPEDGGTLELIGLAILGWGLYSDWAG